MRITQTIPVLPSTDFNRTRRFYALLGFRQISVYPDYLLLERDGQEIHFFLEEGDPAHGHGTVIFRPTCAPPGWMNCTHPSRTPGWRSSRPRRAPGG